MNCKYRQCDVVAGSNGFCGSSHKAGYYRDLRATSAQNDTKPGATSTDPLPNDPDLGATSASALPVGATSSQPIAVQAVDRADRLKYLDKPESWPMTATEVVTRNACAPQYPMHELNCIACGINQCNVGSWMSASELSDASAHIKGRVINRVSLPGDADYNGVAVI